MSNHPSKKPRLDEASASTQDDARSRDATQEAAGLSLASLSTDILNGVIGHSEEVASILGSKLQEYLRIGYHFAAIRDGIVSGYVVRHGDTPATRESARKVAYDFLTRKFHKPNATVRLYIRCYEKLASNIASG
ncbi:TPA: hypothetical protein ACU967_006913 [Burkholderia contaminans]|uniref:hypothetical protein n=1 Tax=Burkholderia TaxID=32008 RepID=UPI0009BFF259|nr:MULTISPECIES: hypothetical protein [Burkholderia]MBM6430646.1 hypothetical protein [Burkholderia contaminans]MBR8016157.1 hypothetical protein [Burkholderia vietnamiensis]MCA7881063.1 hypothetical protein [Burkholderia contaminans]MCB4348900.1 hypothetical protein [Burkholderia vietnamiensis]MDN8026390.1 hypothetical protein [Burkholderia contaminans]